MPSGKSSKAARSTRSAGTATKPKQWGTVVAVLAILIFAGGIFGYLYLRYEDSVAFIPTAENQDPSTKIDGVLKVEYDRPGNRQHVVSPQRVAYDQFPPFGGPHDEFWATCNGDVYEQAVRNENMIHSLEHGAVWIAYNPDQITGAALDSLRSRVEGENYIMLSPYPGLDSPISLQSWGHQLKLTDAEDKRIDQFIRSLRLNNYTSPEVGSPCDVLPGRFDPTSPPPFVAEPPGPDAQPMSSAGASGAEPAAPDGAAPVPPSPGG